MNRLRSSTSGLPITLMEAAANDDRGEKLFVVPKILVIQSKEIIGIGTIGSRNSKTVNFESQVSGYIPSVYGEQAYELERCFQRLRIDCKEINIVGNLKNKSCGNLTGVSIDQYSFLDDENGPHTGWIKVVAKGYRVEPGKNKTKKAAINFA